MQYGSIGKRVITLTLAAVLLVLPALADEVLEEALNKIQYYKLGQDGAPMEYVIGRVLEAQACPGTRAALADRLARVLATDSSFECKKFICRQLYIIGSEAQLPALKPLLTDPDYTSLARYALKNMPGEAATGALLEAAAATTGPVLVGIINDLGERHDPAVLPMLATRLDDRDAQVALAALNGIAEISGTEALRLLRQALAKKRPNAPQAYLACLENMERATGTPATSAQYAFLYNGRYSDPIRMAALSGMVGTGRQSALPAVLDALRAEDMRWYRLGLGCVRRLTQAKATRTFVNLLANLSPERQADVLTALADPRTPERGALDSARKAALRAIKSGDTVVRVAGLRALAHLGTGDTVAVLANVAAVREGEARTAARNALATLRGADINGIILARLETAPPREAGELVRALSARHAVEAVPALLKHAEAGRLETRIAALGALGTLAGKNEMKPLAKLLLQTDNDAIRNATRGALVSVARRLPADQDPVIEIVQAAQASTIPQQVASCFSVLGAVGAPGGLPVLCEGLASPDATIRRAALEALGVWPTGAPLDALFQFAKSTGDKAERAAAVTGCVRMARMPSQRPVERMVALLADLLKLSDDPVIERGVLSALSGLKGPDALALASTFLGDQALASDAAVAVEKIRKKDYVATASHGNNAAAKALDGDMRTRWTTGAVQTPGQWFQVDQGYAREIRGIVLNTTPSKGDYPRGYEVFVFNDPKDMGKAVATGTPDSPVTKIIFAPVRGRYIRIVQTGSVDNLFWSIHELRLMGAMEKAKP